MQQTILALAAILSFAYLALGRQRHDNDVERRAMEIEAELVATDVAQAQMSAMERLAFDEGDTGDTGRTGIRTVKSSFPLTYDGPDEDRDTPSTFDDVDDWNGHSSIVEVPVGAGSLRFRLSVSVRYVQDRNPSEAPEDGKPTFTKELLVQVEEVPPAETDRTPAQVRLRRVVTPASVASYIHQSP